MTTKAEMRTNIRTVTQTDSTELPDATIDMMLSEALQHCAYYVRYWPFYRNNWTVSQLANDFDLTLTGLVDQDANNTATLYHFTRQNQITQIVDTTNNRTLEWITWEEMVALREIGTGTGTGPTQWAFSNSSVADTIDVGYVSPWTIYFYPTPSAAYSLRIDGFRDPIDWVDALDGGSSDVGGYIAAGEPDMPHTFHPAIQNYATGLALAYLDEGDRSIFYLTLAENVLRQQQEIWTSMPQSNAPLVMGGDGLTYTKTLPRRLRYSWET
jgi:hypothetical protein